MGMKWAQLATLGSVAILAAGCGGGGGGNGPTPPPPPSFTTELPNPSSLGGNRLPVADGSGNTVSNPRVGDTFPLQQSVTSLNSTFFGPDNTVQNQGTVIVITDLDAAGGPDGLSFNVPALGISGVNLQLNNDNVFVDSSNTIALVASNAQGNLEYTLFGGWDVSPGGDSPDYFSVFVTGYETPSSALASGTATYRGTAQGSEISGANGNVRDVEGQLELQVNFDTDQIAGDLFNMSVLLDGGGTESWNAIGFEGGSINGTSFEGRTVVNSSAANGGINGDGTGSFNGRFFGPNFDEAGLTWAIRDSAGNVGFGAAAGIQQ